VNFSSGLTEDFIKEDIESENVEENGPRQEGGQRAYYGKRYERKPGNRRDAIKIHGLTCNVCGFNFAATYGEHGSDYIEVHHKKPISTFEGEQPVDPATDLITICSNCHRMIHRSWKNVLTVEELKEMIQKRTFGEE